MTLLGELTDEAPVGATITTGAQEPVTIPVSRYIDPAFAALEMERLWPHVWQLACSVDHVPAPGDVLDASKILAAARKPALAAPTGVDLRLDDNSGRTHVE